MMWMAGSICVISSRRSAFEMSVVTEEASAALSSVG